MRIDHVIYATRDLDVAAAHVETQLGLASMPGGRHEGLGTHNLIVPCGGGYIELLAIADAEEAATSDLGRAVQARIEEGDGLIGWAVAVKDVAAVAQRLDMPVTTIGREGLTARLTGVLEAMTDPVLPFFIERDPGIADPGSGSAGPGISWIELTGDADRLARWLGEGELPVRVRPGPPAVVAIGIGDRVLAN